MDSPGRAKASTQAEVGSVGTEGTTRERRMLAARERRELGAREEGRVQRGDGFLIFGHG